MFSQFSSLVVHISHYCWNYPYLLCKLFLAITTFADENMGIKEIELEIQKLELNERAALAKWLIERLDELTEAEVEAFLTEEADRRLEELERGIVTEIPDKEVLRRARAAIS